MIKQLQRKVYKLFVKHSAMTNVANTLFIQKTMDEVFKLTRKELKRQGYFVTTATLKKYDKYFRDNNITSVQEI